MADDIYEGRLVVVDGDLKAFDAALLEDTPIEDANLRSVYHDIENNCYRFVKPGDPTHNERFHKQYAVIDGTSGPLYNENGEMVYEGDMHHNSILPTDTHFSEGATKNTQLVSDTDEVAEVVTGHTDAYTKGTS